MGHRGGQMGADRPLRGCVESTLVRRTRDSSAPVGPSRLTAGAGLRLRRANAQREENAPLSLADLGIEPMRSSGWQVLARIRLRPGAGTRSTHGDPVGGDGAKLADVASLPR